jgi:hypothetical protein
MLDQDGRMWNWLSEGVDEISERRGIGGSPAPGAKVVRGPVKGGTMDVEACRGVAEGRVDGVDVDVLVRARGV